MYNYHQLPIIITYFGDVNYLNRCIAADLLPAYVY